MSKVCTKCGVEKDEGEFYKKGRGLTAQCKQCIKLGQNARAEMFRDAWNAKRRDRYASDPEYRNTLLRRSKERQGDRTLQAKLRRHADPVGFNEKRRAYYERVKGATSKKQTAVRNARIADDDHYKAHIMVLRARSRARAKRIPFDLSPPDILPLPETCPVLGITLKRVGHHKDPALMSLDRFVPDIGYVRGNVFVISARANDLKKDASIGEMESVLAYMKGCVGGTYDRQD